MLEGSGNTLSRGNGSFELVLIHATQFVLRILFGSFVRAHRVSFSRSVFSTRQLWTRTTWLHGRSTLHTPGAYSGRVRWRQKCRFERDFLSRCCSAVTRSPFPAILVVLESLVVILQSPSTAVPDPRTPGTPPGAACSHLVLHEIPCTREISSRYHDFCNL